MSDAGLTNRSMRSLWLLCFFPGFALAEIVEDFPPEVPTSLMVQLSGGFSATFDFAGGTTERIIVNTGARKLVANLQGCGLASSVHVSNMELHHVDMRTGKPGDFATLLFDVGTESDIRFGKLPRVQLSWRAGHLVDEPLITRLVGENRYFSDRLCPRGPRRNTSLERTHER